MGTGTGRPVAGCARVGTDEDSPAAVSMGSSGMVESATAEEAERRSPAGDWHALRSDPDYRADWQARGDAPPVTASVGFAPRVQTEAGLGAARWGMLALEDPRERSRFRRFWIDGKMLEGEVVEPGESVHPVGMMARATGMNVSGLHLLNGALVLKVQRGRRGDQIWVLAGESFDLERNGLQLQFPFDGYPSAVLSRLWNLAAIMAPRKQLASNR